MTKQEVKDDLAAIIEDEVAAIEAGRENPLADSARISRGNGRSKVLQVRLNPEELAELEGGAATRGLPISTVAREGLVRLRPLRRYPWRVRQPYPRMTRFDLHG